MSDTCDEGCPMRKQCYPIYSHLSIANISTISTIAIVTVYSLGGSSVCVYVCVCVFARGGVCMLVYVIIAIIYTSVSIYIDASMMLNLSYTILIIYLGLLN